jgi:hypothetical protein
MKLESGFRGKYKIFVFTDTMRQPDAPFYSEADADAGEVLLGVCNYWSAFPLVPSPAHVPSEL